jgi:hypothetical protein
MPITGPWRRTGGPPPRLRSEARTRHPFRAGRRDSSEAGVGSRGPGATDRPARISVFLVGTTPPLDDVASPGAHGGPGGDFRSGFDPNPSLPDITAHSRLECARFSPFGHPLASSGFIPDLTYVSASDY